MTITNYLNWSKLFRRLNPRKEVHFHFQSSKAFLVYESLFRLLNRLSPMALAWNSESETFFAFQQPKNRYYVWYFNMFAVVGCIGLGSCLHVLLNWREVPQEQLIFSAIMALTATLIVAPALILVRKAKDIAEGFRVAKQLIQRLTKDSQKQQRKDPWANIAKMQQLVMIQNFLLPPLASGFAVYAEMDPFHFSLPRLFPSLPWKYLFLLRLGLSFTVVTEGLRFYAFFYNLCLFLIELECRCLEGLQNLRTGWRSFAKFKMCYDQFLLLGTIILEPVSVISVVILGFGFVLYVVANVVTLKCANILPPEVYWVAPLFSLLFTIFVPLLLSFVVRNSMENEELLRVRRNFVFGVKDFRILDYRLRPKSPFGSLLTVKEMKILRMEYRNLRPFAVKCGEFFNSKRGADADYMYWVWYRTMDISVLPIYD